MSKKLGVSLLLVSSLCFIPLGYWLGIRSTEHTLTNAERALTAHFLDVTLKDTIEAELDGALARLLLEKRYEAAEDIAQLRYYSRVLVVAKMKSTSSSSEVVSSKANEVLRDAKILWKNHPYAMRSKDDDKELAKVMQ